MKIERHNAKRHFGLPGHADIVVKHRGDDILLDEEEAYILIFELLNHYNSNNE